MKEEVQFWQCTNIFFMNKMIWKLLHNSQKIELYICPWYPRFVCLSIVKRVSMNGWQGLSVYRTVYMHMCMYTSCTLLWRRFSYLIVIFAILSLSLFLSSLSFISLFRLLRVTTAHIHYHFLSLCQYCVYVFFFYSFLLVRAYIDFSRRVFVAHTSSFHFRSIVYPLYARTRTCACQRDKQQQQLLLACRDAQLLRTLIVFPNLSGVGNNILTTQQKLQVRQNSKKWQLDRFHADKANPKAKISNDHVRDRLWYLGMLRTRHICTFIRRSWVIVDCRQSIFFHIRIRSYNNNIFR
jgi:hypothetical protein